MTRASKPDRFWNPKACATRLFKEPGLKRFFRNLSATSLGSLINVFAQLFSIPLYLHVWNRQLYGEWLVLTAVPNLLWSLEGGLGVLAANRMTLSAAAKDWKGTNEIFQTTLLCQLLLSVALFAGAVAIALSTPVATYFGFHITTNAQASSILIIMMGYMILGLMFTVYRAAMRSIELEARSVMLVNCWRLTDLAIIVTVLSFHGNPVRLADGMFTGILFWVGMGYLEVRRKCKHVDFSLSRISWMRLREMVIHGVPLLMGQLTIALYMQGFPLIVNRSLGSATVVTLTTLRTVCRFGLLAVQTVAYSSSAQLSRSYGSGDWAFFRRLLKIMAAVSVWAAIGVTISLSVFGPWILSKWTGGRLTVDPLTIGLFALSVSFQGIWTCCMVTLGACNRHHLFNYGYFGATVLSLTAAFFLTKPLGFEIIPIIMLISDMGVTALGLYLCQTKIPESHLGELSCIFQISYYRNLWSTLLNQQNLPRKARV
jgi:O-antigen/teichoic acid export membrane protein